MVDVRHLRLCLIVIFVIGKSLAEDTGCIAFGVPKSWCIDQIGQRVPVCRILQKKCAVASNVYVIMDMRLSRRTARRPGH